jgi:hypothetical protein
VKEVITASRSILKPKYMYEKRAAASTEDFFQDEDSLDSDDGKLGESLHRIVSCWFGDVVLRAVGDERSAVEQ